MARESMFAPTLDPWARPAVADATAAARGAGVRLHDRAVHDLNEALNYRLHEIARPALSHELRIYRARHQSLDAYLHVMRGREDGSGLDAAFTDHLLSDGWPRVLNRYPALRTALATVTENWLYCRIRGSSGACSSG